jgi:3-oxoacyl-[acyl-carrier protein] reductase
MTRSRVALVAGGSGGIGGAVARRLAAGGVQVVVGYCRNARSAEATAAAIRTAGGAAGTIRLDVNETAGADAVCEAIFETHGRLDILVNCAALNLEAPALGLEDDAWGRVVETNLTAAFRLARAAAKYMMPARWGRIIQLSSVAARFGGRGQINYAASKAGVETMTRVLAIELSRKGVLVNCVAPGVIETAMSADVRDRLGAQLLDVIALRRFGTVDEVAEVVAFLASDAAAYISGQVIRVDGGMGL